MTRSRTTLAVTALASTSLLLSACGGTVGSQSSGGQAAGEGFEVDADQGTVDALIADLDPVTLNFQVPAASPEADLAAVGTVFQDYVEERSNGKITIEVIYGNAIASHVETPDALTDGRVDIAYATTSYLPQDFPEIDAYNAVAGLITPTPQMGALVDTAVMLEQSYEYAPLGERFEERGIVNFLPIFTPASNYFVCSDPIRSADDVTGKQVRGGTSLQLDIIKSLGGSGVDLEFGETYEALQRGTIDCTISGMPNAADGGVFEVAPYASYPTDGAIPGGNGSVIGGRAISELPLAYQQIIFDGTASMVEGKMLAQINGNESAFQAIKGSGGDVFSMDDAMATTISDRVSATIAEHIEQGHLPEDVTDQVTESEERWTAVFEELGYSDAGSTETFGDWGERDFDYQPAADAVFDQILSERRPS